MIIDDNEIRQIWMKTIGNIDKYFHSPLVNKELNIREFVISSKKAWAFNMLNKVYGNVNEGEYVEPYRATMSKGCKRVCVFEDISREYRLYCKPYLNGNTLITLHIIDK